HRRAHRAGHDVRRPRRDPRRLSIRGHGARPRRAPEREPAFERDTGYPALTSPASGVTNNGYMGPFQYRDSELCCEAVSLRALAAVAGTPPSGYPKREL